MSLSLTEIKQQILELSRGDQLALHAFLGELLQRLDPEFDRHWGAIATQRLEDLRSGKTKGIPLEKVLNELREHLPSDAEDDPQTRERR